MPPLGFEHLPPGFPPVLQQFVDRLFRAHGLEPPRRRARSDERRDPSAKLKAIVTRNKRYSKELWGSLQEAAATCNTSCVDVTVELLDYDWRTASNHPDAQLQPHVHKKPEAQGSQQPPVPAARPPTPTPVPDSEKPPSPISFNLRRSDLAPGLVPEFFRSHLAPPSNAVKAELVGSSELPPSPPGTSVVSSYGAPNYFSMGAPLQPNYPPTSTAAASPHDPAANMLNVLQNKLDGIQACVKSLPRTGFANKSYGYHYVTPTPQLLPEPSGGDTSGGDILGDALDDDFVALVSWQSSSCLGKRKAASQDVVLDPKVADLKARNRASAKASRERKKAHLENLHKQIDQLTTQNLELASTCQDVAKDNEKLREDLKLLGFLGDTHDDVKEFINRLVTALNCSVVRCIPVCMGVRVRPRTRGRGRLATTSSFLRQKIQQDLLSGVSPSSEDISKIGTHL